LSKRRREYVPNKEFLKLSQEIINRIKEKKQTELSELEAG